MGAEGQISPCPFLIEGPFRPIECIEERPAVGKVGNFLPLSPRSKGIATFTLQATTLDGDDLGSIAFKDYTWDPGEFECLVGGDRADKNSNRNKLHLYWLQSGRCVGCQRTVYFDLMEIDHIIPGDKGSGCVVGNVQLLCGSCNKIEGKRSMEVLVGELKKRGLPGDFNHTGANIQ